ncbi:MAG: hypothetical protein ACRDUV_22935 [Pseudonocardiaceae bacterium]
MPGRTQPPKGRSRRHLPLVHPHTQPEDVSMNCHELQILDKLTRDFAHLLVGLVGLFAKLDRRDR